MNRATLLSIIPAILSLAVFLTPVHADISYTGQLDPADPADWDNETDGIVGNSEDGTLTIDGGTLFESYGCHIGYSSGVSGAVTVDGVNTKWTNSAYLYIGMNGNGTLNIANGGTVSLPGLTGFAMSPGATGRLIFGENGGVLDTGSLFASPVQLRGTGVINTGGLVSDIDLVFDKNHGLAQTFVFDSLPNQHVTLNLDVSKENSMIYLGAGYYGNHKLDIKDGHEIYAHFGYAGIHAGSTGVITVAGEDTTFDTARLYIGRYGNGVLNITNGANVDCWLDCYIGAYEGSKGQIAVVGENSVLAVQKAMFGTLVGFMGEGSLSILDGASATTMTCIIGYLDSASGIVTVDGTGSTLTSNNIRFGPWGTGKIIISGGGKITLPDIGVSSGCMLTIDIGSGSLLDITSEYIGIGNSGIIRFLAGAEASSGVPYSPISSLGWSGTGVYQAVGGTWDGDEHEFTVSAVVSGDVGEEFSVLTNTYQRALIEDDGVGGTGWTLGASFLHKTGEDTELLVTATAVEGDSLADLQALINTNADVLGAWEIELAGEGYAEDDPVYLSFAVGEGYKRGDLAVWYYDGSDWSSFDAMDLTVNDGWASFTVTEFSGYAVSAAVPEPGTLVLLVIAALAFIARRKRR